LQETALVEKHWWLRVSINPTLINMTRKEKRVYFLSVGERVLVLHGVQTDLENRGPAQEVQRYF